jgi:phosphoglycolate phosphatase-like HAD superfamily hydrolase
LPGVAPVLDQLARLNIVQSLATGNTPAVARIKLSALRVGHQLDLKIGSYGTDSPLRPDLVKHAIDRATKHHGAIPGAVIVVGDTPWDMDAACAHGAVAVGIATGAYTEEELASSGARLALPSLGTPQHRQRLYRLLGIGGGLGTTRPGCAATDAGQ